MGEIDWKKADRIREIDEKAAVLVDDCEIYAEMGILMDAQAFGEIFGNNLGERVQVQLQGIERTLEQELGMIGNRCKKESRLGCLAKMEEHAKKRLENLNIGNADNLRLDDLESKIKLSKCLAGIETTWYWVAK